MTGLQRFTDNFGAGFFYSRYRFRTYYICYTFLFLLCCVLVFFPYISQGRTLIWSDDGWKQHYRALIYWAQYLRTIARTLINEHSFVLPEWSFAFGEGNDILQTLHYYVIGDPFALFSVFVPVRYMWIYYGAMILLRLYLAGIAFSCLCFYVHKDAGRYGVMGGALVYAFCFWAIYNANRHPYFLNPLVYFPLLVLGIEKLIKQEKPYIFILSVFLSAVSNFYFFYVIVLLAVIYTAVRLIAQYGRDFRGMLITLWKLIAFALIGTLMGGVIVIPICFAFFSDARMGSGNLWHLVYPYSYYASLPGSFFSGLNGYWLCLGYSAPVILSVFLLFLYTKKNGMIKCLHIVSAVILLIPACGQLLNGMSYMSNRYSWVIALLCAYTFTVMWPSLMNLRFTDTFILTLCMIIYFAVLIVLKESRDKAALAGIGIALLFLLCCQPMQSDGQKSSGCWRKLRQAAALLMVLAGIVNVSFFENASSEGNYAGEAVKIADAVSVTDSEAELVREISTEDKAEGFYRYSGRNLTPNSNICSGIGSTQYYWTISNPAVTSFKKALEMRENRAYAYTGYDDETAVTALSAVRYYIVNEDDSGPIPYGFAYLDTVSGHRIYHNDQALGLSYSYDKIIGDAAWKGLSAVQRQEAMLQSVYLDVYTGETQEDAIVYTDQAVPYIISIDGDGIAVDANGIKVTDTKSTVTMIFNGTEGSETYVAITGLNYTPLRQNDGIWLDTGARNVDIQLESSTGVKKINYYTPDHSWYNGRHDFTVNLGYSEDSINIVRLSFSKKGYYSFDSFKLTCLPMEHYPEQIRGLSEDVLENVNIDADIITGSISLDKDKILCFSIPYSVGWSAYVDGEKADLYQANIRHMALKLHAGEHEIRLVYHTPYLRLGACVSLLGLLCLSAHIIYMRRNRQE